MNELQASLLEAINTVSRGNDNNNVQTVTIEAEIVSVEDLAKGIYKAKYQSSTMTVYSTGAVYNVGQHVYIIVPNGDFSKNKVILGPSGGLDIVSSDEDKVIEGEVEYIEATQNLLDLANTEAYICSYEHSTYESAMRSSDSFKAATKKYKKFKLSCDIQTKLPAEQQKAMGEYGFKIRYKTTVGYFEVKIDTSNILGNPYSLTQWSHQYVTFDFPENAELDLSEAPVCMWYTGGTFYQKEDQPADIFFKNMQLTALMELPIVSGYYLYLVPDNGLTFTDIIKEINIKPDLRLDGVSINLSQKSAQCYWFVQDNSVLSADDAGYLPLMGARWRCINKKNDEDVFVSDVNYTLNIKSDNVFITEKYSCLIVYDDITYRQEVTIEQFNSSIHFEIKADAEHYIAGTGKVTLNALSDYTPETAEVISYSWARYDKNGSYIDSNWWETSSDLDSTIVFPTSIIDVKNTFSCSLISNKYDKPLATATYEIVVEEFPTIRLVTYNTNVLYKYDVNGVSPFHPSYGGSLGKSYATINPIIFKIFKEDGKELTEVEYADCIHTWTISSNTMLDLDRNWLNADETAYVLTTRDFQYGIRSYYSAARNENTVTLSVVFNGVTYTQQFEIQFIKDGANGTNGTDYVGSIVCEGKDRILIQGIEGNDKKPYIIQSNGKPRNIEEKGVQLSTIVYNLGQQVNISYKVKWEMIEPDKTLFKIDKDTGVLTYKENIDVITAKSAMDDDNNNINIVRASINVGDTTIYAYKVIEYLFFYAVPNVENFSVDNGPFEVVFNSDGSRAEMKATDPFVAMYGEENKRIVDNSVSEDSWTIGADFDLIADEDSGVSKRYLKILKNLGDKIHTVLYVAGNHNNGDSWKYYRPILLRKNTYGMADLNSWDGTRLYLDEDGNYMYAAQVGAGTKNATNQFTGVIMGTDNSNNQGLFGFKDGQRSFFLDAKTGIAEFGLNENGRIIIDPKKEALIYGGNYQTGKDGSGMLINLTKPCIKFGSGKFEVDENGILSAVDGKFTGTVYATDGEFKGKIIAKDGGEIGGWTIDADNQKLYAGTDTSAKLTLDAKNKKIYSGSKSTLNTNTSGFYIGTDGIGLGTTWDETQADGSTVTRSKFQVDKNGNAYFRNAYLKGEIEADSGHINGTLTIGNANGYKAYLQKASSGTQAIFYVQELDVNGNQKSIPFRINGNGSMIATKGKIGGYDIGTSTLKSANGKVGMSSSETSDFAFWAGSATPASAPFSVDYSGKIAATAGAIGGFDISTSYISSAGTNFASSGLTLSTANFTRSINGTDRSLRFAIGSKFGVASDGTVYAAGATFSGTISAGSGSTIGGFTVASNALQTTDKKVGFGSGTYAFWAGNATPSSAPFRVDNTGKVTCTNISISSNGSIQLGDVTLNKSGIVVSGTSYSKMGGWSILTNKIAKNGSAYGVGMSSDSDNYAFWAGGTDANGKPSISGSDPKGSYDDIFNVNFGVRHNGEVIARAIRIEGYDMGSGITSTKIGPFNILGNWIAGDLGSYNGSPIIMEVGKHTLALVSGSSPNNGTFYFSIHSIGTGVADFRGTVLFGIREDGAIIIHGKEVYTP